MRCRTMQELFDYMEIYANFDAFGGAPLIVNIESPEHYEAVYQKIICGFYNVLHVSEFASDDRIPAAYELFEFLESDENNDVNCAVFGLSQLMMLQGEEVLKNNLEELTERIIRPVRCINKHVIIVLYQCGKYLAKYEIGDPRLRENIAIFCSGKFSWTKITVTNSLDLAGKNYCFGFRELLQALENPVENRDVTFLTGLPLEVFDGSLYAIKKMTDAHSELSRRFPELIGLKSYGTEEQWLYLFELVREKSGLKGKLSQAQNTELRLLSLIPS